MSGIKETPADLAFSMCVRERAERRCEVCGKYFPVLTSGLHCAHYFSRGDWSTRFAPDNCISLCYGHHEWMDGHHHQFREFMEKRLGSESYAALVARNNDTVLGKLFKLTKGKSEIAAFYRQEYCLMQMKRAEGKQGWLEFSEWSPG